jgi:salicylate hydroxylase
MLPFLAQGAGMAIEDAAVLAACVGRSPADLPAAFRAYEAARRSRTAKVQAAARQTGHVYHLAGPLAVGRNLAMRALGGGVLIRRYGWIYGWRPPEPDPRLRNEVAPAGGTEAVSMAPERGDHVSNPAASGGAAPERLR